jgi:phosphorylcholine metabolism protein LicD
MTVLFFICFVACTRKKDMSGDIIIKEKMQAILWDIFQADAFTEQYIKKDSSKNPALENARLQQQIFSIHKVSRQDFQRSYLFYKTHPTEMKILLDSISAKAERERNTMMIKKYSGNHQIE